MVACIWRCLSERNKTMQWRADKAGGGWIEVRGKHYCEECHHYGDNDELILGDGTVITVDEEDWQ